MEKQNKIGVYKGDPVNPGVSILGTGINFAVEIPCGVPASLVLYRKGTALPEKEIPFTEEYRTGRMCAMLVTGLKTGRYEYNFRIDGRICQDPFAQVIRGREKFGMPLSEEEHAVRCAFLSEKEYDWQDDKAPKIPYNEMILYKVHVRGYTRQAKILSRKRGTFAGLVEMIPYWKELGINAVELMPAYEFQECPKTETAERTIRSRQDDRINYWGYTQGFYFAPKASYCATREPDREFRDMIREFHKAGIECIMEMYFPEGTPALQVLRSLWMWKLFYHVDGFHLMGDGVHQKVIERDPILYGTKKMFSEMDGNTEAENMLAEYNAGFMQDMRRFLKSDEGMISGAEFHVRRNAGIFGTVNYMTSQDGFTLYDTVSYNYRHNEANGEDNRDGSEFNYSWNCGVEGPTRRQVIRRMREQQMRNAFFMLLLSQGTPMIYGGDEFANSQAGNNNAWCQDNAVGWTDWKNLKKYEALAAFVKEAIAFRKNHPILHMPQEMRGVDYMAKGFPDISVHGERAWFLNRDNTSRLLGVMYCGAYAEREDGTTDDFIYIGMNFHWEKRNIALPNLPEGLSWKKVADTSNQTEGQWFGDYEETYKKSTKINPRTIVVLIAKREESEHASVAALQDNNEA